MGSVTIKMGATGPRPAEYVLTDEHPACSHGQPVLVDENGDVFGPWECPIDNPNAKMPGGETYRWQMTARAIAAYARDDHPGDSAVLDLVRRFESIPQP